MTSLTGPLDQKLDVDMRRYLRVPDVARLMEVPESTVYDLARQERIAGLIRFGRHIRFDRDKLERWLDAGGEALPGGGRRDER